MSLPEIELAWPAYPVFTWPAYPAWIWPALPALNVTISGSLTSDVVVAGGRSGSGDDVFSDFVDDGNYATEEEEIESLIESVTLEAIASNTDIRAALEALIRDISGG